MLLYNHNKHAHIPPIIIDNHIIEYSSHIKNLGITLNPQLSFTQYITNISKSINQTLHTIRMIRPSITKELAQLLVVSTILPKLDYCNSTLNSIPQYSIKRLNSLQYSAARTIFRIKKYSRIHMTPYLKSLHWLPISQRINYKILLLTHHATHKTNLIISLNYLLSTILHDYNELLTHLNYKSLLPPNLYANKNQHSRLSLPNYGTTSHIN